MSGNPVEELSDLGGDVSFPEWRRVEWADDCECGEPDIVGPAEDDGAMYDGDPAVCLSCGAVFSVSVDESGDYDSDDRPIYGASLVDRGERVSYAALRLLREVMNPDAEETR